ncbi:MAG: Hsp20/alpha crystallin family protein, partial [Nitrososphaeraceae archaeon]
TDRQSTIESQRSLQTRHMDDIFGSFRRDIEDIMMPWPSSSSSSSLSQSPLWNWRLPSVSTNEHDEYHEMIIRMPIFDMLDKEDRYELKVEIPGIEKEKVKVKATKDSLEISGEQSKEEESEDKRKRYVYNERSYNSFYRSIPIPEEIVSSKVRAKMSNGVLHIELPKKNPTKLEEQEGTTVEIV